MHPDVLREYEAAKSRTPSEWVAANQIGRYSAAQAIIKGKHFFINDDVAAFAINAAKHSALLSPDEAWAAPEESFVPSDSGVILAIPGGEYGATILHCKQDGDAVMVFFVGDGMLHPFGCYRPGGVGTAAAHVAREVSSEEDIGLGCAKVAVLLALVNSPRKVLSFEDVKMPRQQRRALERKHVIAPAAYTRVSWEVGEAVKAKIAIEDRANYGVPLHWRRAHLRQVDKATEGAMWINGAWRVKVRESWPGHPAFGVKLQVHEPRLPGSKAAKGAAPTMVSADRLAVMDAQKAAAIREAMDRRGIKLDAAPDEIGCSADKS